LEVIHGLQELDTPKHFLLTPGADCRGERQVSKKERWSLGKKNVTFVGFFFLLFVCEDEIFFSLRNNFYLVAKCHCKNLLEKTVNHPSVYSFCCVRENITLNMW
jgi:hypothetical protein